MRDNHEGMPEIVDAFERDGHYFCQVRLERGGQYDKFQIGVSRAGYLAVRRAFEARPFGAMPGRASRIFFARTYRRLDDRAVMMYVRTEQDKQGKQIEVEAPEDLVANLLWFAELKDWSVASHLRSV
jgi:hypothetical protein